MQTVGSTQAHFLFVTLIRPTGAIQADFLSDLGNHLMVGFDRPMEPSDLQGAGSKFPWTDESKVSLVHASGAPKMVHCNRLARYCREHQVCWLDSDYPCCPRCDELDAP